LNYYVKIDDMPTSPTYEQPQSLHRFGYVDGDLVLERWDPVKREWVDDPGLLDATGITGEHNYLPISEMEAKEILETLEA